MLNEKRKKIIFNSLDYAANKFVVFALLLAISWITLGYYVSTADAYMRLLTMPKDDTREAFIGALAVYTTAIICFNWWLVTRIRNAVKRLKAIQWE